MKIIIEIKSVYGEEKFYPVCEVAKKFCELLGTKTLTDRAIKNILDLGYEVDVKQKQYSFNKGA
jgi:hypothetical protein